MPSLGLIEDRIPAGSPFDPAVYSHTLAGIPDGRLRLPFVLWGELTGRRDVSDQCLQESRAVEIKVDSDAYLCLSAVPQDCWQALPLASHDLVDAAGERSADVTRALEHLARSYPEGYKLFAEFVRMIAWVKLRDDRSEQDVEITSSSFPVLPFSVFVSSRALSHIPPKTVAARDSYRFLAENLFHEAVHQAVNMNLLLHDIFTEDYNSSTSPKVDIPWRANNDQRNQRWEIDRTLHAAVVYGHLLGYRRRQLNDPGLESFEYAAFAEAAAEGLEAAKYLSQSLLRYERYFTTDGIKVIRSLAQEIGNLAQSVG
ncbi:hypothetical protein G3578_13730 [Brevibacillus sp. SYP-B805]|uniref:hypothetical protein n=1 Tax=Brevibacillus sp. SYP-B805 TaxID=1578199 RepID=UPI0013EA4369|nr:hypothetical protein [Brevibacillus sp. SYP-B805]NGQ96221.1 hypothetical protein [Brevibacillus sp. SYP-B805]